MSTTTTVNPVNPGNTSDDKKKAAAYAATAASAAGIGVAGAHIVSEFDDIVNDTSEETVTPIEVIDETSQPETAQGDAGETSSPTSTSSLQWIRQLHLQ